MAHLGMAHAPFVHLRVRSAYSLTEGAIKVADLPKLCAADAMPAVAVTDNGNLFGALEFALAAVKAGVQPIIGCTLPIAVSHAGEGHSSNGNGGHCIEALPLLAQDEAGYLNLLSLVSEGYVTPAAGAPSLDGYGVLEGRTNGLIALTGGTGGGIGRALAEGQKDRARQLATSLSTLFPGRLYMEITRHGTDLEAMIEDGLVELAYDMDLPLVATNEVYFAEQEMYEAHDALLCIADRTHVSDTRRRRLTRQHRFRKAEEMAYAFADLPEAIANTLVIARRCAYYPTEHDPILPRFQSAEGLDEADALRAMAEQGLDRRLADIARTENKPAEGDWTKPYRDRLVHELDVIVQMGFPGYFLIVADFIQWAKGQGIPVGPGRGSGAGSVAAWSLGITDLDPLRWGLLFERFLNPERVSMPDFDIDFCKDRRDEVIHYVQDKYGHDRVAQIITFGKLEARAVVRDAGRVLEMPYGQVDRIAKMIPYNPAKPVTLKQAIEGEPRLQEMRDKEEAVKRLLETALQLEGLFRNASTHAAGVVIGDRPLTELVPLYKDPGSDMPATQFNMKLVEKAGLVKFDFLGLKTLTVIREACDILAARGTTIDIDHIPLDDRHTFEMLTKADVTGVFQMESGGVRDVLRRLKPDRFEDIIAVVALYRPGPMENIPSYINRKHGREAPDFMHGSLEPILAETHGIMIYQEQVMQIAQVLAGYTLGDADLLRRAMGKKIQAEMDAQKESFVEGAKRNEVGPDTARRIFDQVNKFAGYGFNKSHAAAYALVAYQTAYLKANYPVEFFAASMTHDMGNTEKLAGYRNELLRQDIAILPPDVNASHTSFAVENDAGGKPAIRYALCAIKGVGRQAMEDLVAEREANGPFADPFDLAARLDTKVVNKRQLENLIAAGAFDSLNRNRSVLHQSVDRLVRWSQAAQAARTSSQSSLFGGGDADQLGPPPGLAGDMDWATMERLKREFEVIGFYLSAHPLDAFDATLRRLGVVSYADLPAWLRDGGTGRPDLAGIVLAVHERTSSRTGNRFAHVMMSDSTGSFEVTLFSEMLAVSRNLLTVGQPVIVSVDAQQQDDDLRLVAQRLEPLDKRADEVAVGMQVYVGDSDTLSSVRTVIADAGEAMTARPGGANRGRIVLMLDVDQREVELELPGRYPTGAQVRSALRELPGVVDVREMA